MANQRLKYDLQKAGIGFENGDFMIIGYVSGTALVFGRFDSLTDNTTASVYADGSLAIDTVNASLFVTASSVWQECKNA